jgi:DNA-binding transcriptional ArsR family regulator
MRFYKTVIFSPSFWTTPLIAPGEIDAETLYFIYGKRPTNIPFVPGGLIPDNLPQTLKILVDPTRLKILKLLRQEPHTPTDISKKLRLRPPTVSHHLQALRQVRLVRITLSEDDRRIYEFRPDGLNGVWDSLKDFLELD